MIAYSLSQPCILMLAKVLLEVDLLALTSFLFWLFYSSFSCFSSLPITSDRIYDYLVMFLKTKYEAISHLMNFFTYDYSVCNPFLQDSISCIFSDILNPFIYLFVYLFSNHFHPLLG